MFSDAKRNFADPKKRPFIILIAIVSILAKAAALYHLHKVQDKNLDRRIKIILTLMIIVISPGALLYFAWHFLKNMR
jgi:hypothetical protein